MDSITKDQNNDVFYTFPVSIGTPAQPLIMTPDSGSSDFWVWSTFLPPATRQYANATGAALYNPVNSSSQTPVNGKWSIHYGDGSFASGSVVLDVVQVGDITIQAQGVEIASSLSSSLVSQPASQGILGLGFGSLVRIPALQGVVFLLTLFLHSLMFVAS